MGRDDVIKFLDIFAGAGGLSEGFIREGYEAVSHIEMDAAACYTLKTRAAYHYLNNNGKIDIYNRYIKGEIDRGQLYASVPNDVIDSVKQKEITEESLPELFDYIDSRLKGQPLDLIIGGPPCQAYSLAGRSRDPNRMVGDKRNYLFVLYAKFLERYKPKYFVFENVLGLLSAKDEDGNLYLKQMLSLFKKIGYATEYRVLNAKEYGVLQERKRIILIGKRNGELGFYPEISKVEAKYTIKDLFDDLPKLHAGEGSSYGKEIKGKPDSCLVDTEIRTREDTPISLHSARPNNKRDQEIYRLAVDAWNNGGRRLNYASLPERLKTHKNTKSFLDRFKVVAGNLPYSQTVVAHISKDGHYYIHPDIEQNRSITPREAARLQTFPDDYYFESISGKPSRTYAFKQIGNAVPVLLAERVAEALKLLFEDEAILSKTAD